MYDPYEDIFLNYTLNTDLMPANDMLHHTKKKRLLYIFTFQFVLMCLVYCFTNRVLLFVCCLEVFLFYLIFVLKDMLS